MADEFRKYNSTREIIKLDLVDTNDYTDNVILCVPKFAYDVARSMLGHYGKFRTSYAASYGDQFYKLPSDVEFDTIEASLDLFLGSRDMSCDITEGLECICNQLAELTAATYTSALDANYAGVPEQAGGVDGGDPPAGAGDPLGTITDRKCRAAHFIVDNYLAIMFDLYTSSPPAWYSIGEVATYIQGIGGNSGFASMIADIYNFYATVSTIMFGATVDYEAIYTDIDDNYSELICALIVADNAVDAIDNFLDALTITGDDYDVMESWLKNNIINVLWFSVADSEVRIANYTTTENCALCGCPLSLVVYGTYVGTTLTSAILGASHTASMTFDTDGCGATVTIDSFSLLSGNPANATDLAYRFYDTDDNFIYADNDFPTGLFPMSGVKKVIIVDTVAPYNTMTFSLAYTEE